VAVVVAGCAQQGPDVNYVEGVVTLDGQPIEGVAVGFSPVDASKGTAAVGTTDANGVFKLTSTAGGATDAGAMPGDYNVTFMKSAVDVVTAEEAQRMQNDPNYGQSSGELSAAPVAKSAIPEAYNNPATSGVKATVASGKNEFKFDLKSDFKGGAQ
jgi:hypothetical protein